MAELTMPELASAMGQLFASWLINWTPSNAVAGSSRSMAICTSDGPIFPVNDPDYDWET